MIYFSVSGLFRTTIFITTNSMKIHVSRSHPVDDPNVHTHFTCIGSSFICFYCLQEETKEHSFHDTYTQSGYLILGRILATISNRCGWIRCWNWPFATRPIFFFCKTYCKSSKHQWYIRKISNFFPKLLLVTNHAEFFFFN